jgi:hypothetical protein
MSMFHSTTERLIEYWRGQAAGGGLPPRAAINPADFPDLAPRVFILGRAFTGVYPLRLVGGFVADLHGRDLRRRNGLSLWAERDRPRLQTALEEARRRPEPIVVRADMLSDAGSLAVEILFAPLAGPDGSADRFLGLYQPLGMTHRLHGRPVTSLVVRAIFRDDGADEQGPRLRLATLDGRRIA